MRWQLTVCFQGAHNQSATIVCAELWGFVGVSLQVAFPRRTIMSRWYPQRWNLLGGYTGYVAIGSLVWGCVVYFRVKTLESWDIISHPFFEPPLSTLTINNLHSEHPDTNPPIPLPSTTWAGQLGMDIWWWGWKFPHALLVATQVITCNHLESCLLGLVSCWFVMGIHSHCQACGNTSKFKWLNLRSRTKPLIQKREAKKQRRHWEVVAIPSRLRWHMLLNVQGHVASANVIHKITSLWAGHGSHVFLPAMGSLNLASVSLSPFLVAKSNLGRPFCHSMVWTMLESAAFWSNR